MDDLNVKFLLQNMGQRGAKGREKFRGGEGKIKR
jgi:hypothetical protein